MSFCPRCGARSDPGAAFCGACGHALATAPSPSSSPLSPSAPSSSPQPSTGLAVAGLLLNLFLWPGLGSLVAGDKRGWPQGFLALGGAALAVFAFFAFFAGVAADQAVGGAAFGILAALAGFGMSTAAWIWALITSIQHLSNKA